MTGRSLVLLLVFFCFALLSTGSAELPEHIRQALQSKFPSKPSQGHLDAHPPVALPEPPPPSAPVYSDDPLFFVFQNNETQRAPLNQDVWKEMRQHDYLFVGGQHRSGTSLLHYLLAAHPNISGFTFDKGQREGQHVQSLYKTGLHLEKVLSSELSCGIREGIFPGKEVESTNGFHIYMQYTNAHMTEKTAPFVSAEANAQLWGSWHPKWDETSHFRVEKSPPDLIRSRFLQAHFPNSQFLMIARHPLAVAMPIGKKGKVCTKETAAKHLLSLRAHLQTFGLAWLWYVPEDLPHLNKAVLLRLEDVLVDVQTWYAALLDVLGIAREVISTDRPLARPDSWFVGRQPLYFHGSMGEKEVTVDAKERTEWFPVWERLQKCFGPAGLDAELRSLIDEYEPVLNIFGYSAHPPYILSNKGMPTALSKASWQAVVHRGEGVYAAEKVVGSSGSNTSSEYLRKLARCRVEKQTSF